VKRTINVPDSLKDITVGQYQEWDRLMKKAQMSTIRQKVVTVAIFCKEDIETIEKLTLRSLNRIHEELAKVLDDAFKNDLVRVIEVNGTKYGFHPDMDEMTTGEWADLEEEMREAGDLWMSMPQVLSILYRPILKRKWWKFWKKGYQIEPYSPKHIENAEAMKQVDMHTASGMAVFFWRSAIESTKSIIQSIKLKREAASQ
jgi:hypothetical protein